MADLQINGLPANAGLVGTEEVAVQLTGGGANQKSTTQDIADLAPAGSASGYAVGPGLTVEPVAPGTDALAMGDSAVGNGTSAITIGSGSETFSTGQIAIGQDAFAGDAASGSNDNNISIGKGASSSTTSGGYGALCLGAWSKISRALGAIAIGSDNGNAGTNGAEVLNAANAAIAIGSRATAGSVECISIGFDSNSAGNNGASIAIGAGASATGAGLSTSAIAIGDGAGSTGSGGIAIGTNTDTTNSQAIAIGDYAQGTGFGVIVIGQGASAAPTTASGTYGAAIGVAGCIQDRPREWNISSGLSGDGRSGMFVEKFDTTDQGTGTFTIAIPVDSSMFVEGMLIGRRTDSDTNPTNAYKISAVIDNNAGTLGITTPAAEIIQADDAAVTVVFSISGANLLLTVTGGTVGATVQWILQLKYVEARG